MWDCAAPCWLIKFHFLFVFPLYPACRSTLSPSPSCLSWLPGQSSCASPWQHPSTVLKAVQCASSPLWPRSQAARGCTSPQRPAGGVVTPGRYHLLHIHKHGELNITASVTFRCCYFWLLRFNEWLLIEDWSQTIRRPVTSGSHAVITRNVHMLPSRKWCWTFYCTY